MGAAIALSIALLIGILVHNADAWSRVDVGITAYAHSEPPPGKQFVLQGPDPRYPGGDPSWPAYARILTKALEAKGFVPVASSPDLIIREKDPIAGGTIYHLADRMDAGAIAAQEWCFVKKGETARELWERALAPLGLKLLAKVIDHAKIHNKLPATPQDETFATQAPALVPH